MPRWQQLHTRKTFSLRSRPIKWRLRKGLSTPSLVSLSTIPIYQAVLIYNFSIGLQKVAEEHRDIAQDHRDIAQDHRDIAQIHHNIAQESLDLQKSTVKQKL